MPLATLLANAGCAYKVHREFINGGDRPPLMTSMDQLDNLGAQDAVAFVAGNVTRVDATNEVIVRYMVRAEAEPKKPKEPKRPKDAQEKKPKEAEPKKPKEPKKPQPKGKAPFVMAIKKLSFKGKWQELADVKEPLPNDEIPVLLVAFNAGSAKFEGNVDFFDHLPDDAVISRLVGTVDMKPNPLVWLPYIGGLFEPYAYSDSKVTGDMKPLEGTNGVHGRVQNVTLEKNHGIGFRFMMKLPPFPKKK